MDLLIIGGTQFVGRHLVEAACRRGDRVTVFNRGLTPDELPLQVARLRGDRRKDLSALADRRWDAVIDCCGYLPGEVAHLAQHLADRIGCYAFISTVTAYADATRPNDETSPLGRIDDGDTDVVDSRTYGPLKAFCEAALAQRIEPARRLVIRPGLVVGPHDPTQRFTWWPARLARAALDRQPVLVPGAPLRPLQFIDARDLAGFVLQALDREVRGTFNVISPPGFTTMAGLLDECARAAGATEPLLRWIDEAALLRAGLKPWNELPLWMPASGEYAAFMAMVTAKGEAAGLRIRPLAETVADTLAWWRGLPPDQQAFTKAGLAPEREAALLASFER
ncbi:epimerase [Aquincola sp. S2]|uniref:Epimerase n=1 Tax=Pseudaquabacterium terrae TaxID=2732868 RepID=A0ABX2EFL9_9BURK|nr:NAD-dependent epimerase/dehydratase family protein [Aquabacterium terrae]NRF67403.1 epimerase [Aquabacterium terrae]